MTVKAAPRDPQGVYRVDVVEYGFDRHYVVEYRASDGSLAGVFTVDSADGGIAEKPFISNTSRPFLDTNADRKLIDLDFPVAPYRGDADNPMRFPPGDSLVKRVEQRFERKEGGVRIILEREGAVDMRRVVLDWNAGEPWWSTARVHAVFTCCIEDGGPREFPLASGTLLRDADAGPPR